MRWFNFQRTHPIRLEPRPWTGRERRRKSLPEWTGTVVAKSANGIKAVDDGGWLNFTKEEWRGQPFDDCQRGDKVRIEYAEDDKGRTYISVIENLSRPGDIGPQPESDNPFPPEKQFPPDEDFPPDEPQEASAPVLDIDHSIVRQTCIKAAGMALQHNMGNAEEKAGQMTYLAGVLEDWVWRT